MSKTAGRTPGGANEAVARQSASFACLLATGAIEKRKAATGASRENRVVDNPRTPRLSMRILAVEIIDESVGSPDALR